MNAAVETTQARHPVLSNGYGSIQIDGFSGLIPKKCFCIMADGHRYARSRSCYSRRNYWRGNSLLTTSDTIQGGH